MSRFAFESPEEWGTLGERDKGDEHQTRPLPPEPPEVPTDPTPADLWHVTALKGDGTEETIARWTTYEEAIIDCRERNMGNSPGVLMYVALRNGLPGKGMTRGLPK